MQSRLGEGIRWSCQTTGSRAAPLPVSPYERDMFPLPSCPIPLRVKGCWRTLQTSGRMRLATDLANDAVSIGSLATKTRLASTKSILPSGAISVTRVFDVSRQCTSDDRCVALSDAQGDVRLLCLVVSKDLGLPQENGCISPVGSTQTGGVWRRNNSE